MRRTKPRVVQACWLAQYDPRERRCRGRMDPAHLLKQQWLERAGVKDPWDRRLWVPACRLHHGEFDAFKLSVPLEALPWSFLQVCDELGLTPLVDRRYKA